MATAKKKKKAVVKKDYLYAVGRRKTATARVRLYQKKGDLLVNDMAAGKYFSGILDAASAYMLPFKLTNSADSFSFSAKIQGSGKMAQLDALIHGLSRALAAHNVEEYRPVLKTHGLLTRDDRMKESRKIGTGGKARRKKQSPKR